MDATGHVPRQSNAMPRAGRPARGLRDAAGGAGWRPARRRGKLGGLFRAVAPAGVTAVPGSRATTDSLTLRRRLVSIDFEQLSPPVDAAAAGAAGAAVAPARVLRLNLFDDASLTGLVESVAPTFSGRTAPTATRSC